MAIIRAHIPAGPDGQTPQRFSANILSRDPRPPLSFTDDGPGRLSLLGPRHDNDHDDFRKIKILPTQDEILAIDRPVYMPKKDLTQQHFLENGPGRHLDTLFRQLRCDSTETIRDICYSAAQVAFLKIGSNSDGHVRQETSAGHRYFLYRNIRVQELLSHEHKSMVVRVSYDCPPFMRGRNLYESGRFQNGMLVALLQLNNTTMEFSVYYMEVTLAQTTFSMDAFNGRGTQAAVQLNFLPTSSHDDVLQLCRHALGLKMDNELYLVEFPKILFAGVYNCLKCLQDMKDSDFAFPQYVAPRISIHDALLARELNFAVGSPSRFPCLPPSYARAPEFRYNLEKTVGPHSPISSVSLEDLCRPSTLDILKRETTLDEGQAVAFRDSLMRDFACTQGPPGCGKTYLGLKVAQAVLESRPVQKPVLLVCLTNHALDSFLADLRDAGVSGLLRVGSGSKEEWTNSINLRDLRRKIRFKREESNVMQTHTLQKKESIAGLDELCKAVSCQSQTGAVPWHYVRDVLYSDHRDVHAQFTTTANVPLAQSFTFEYWSAGGDLTTIRDLHLELANRLAQASASRDKRPAEDVDKLLFDLSWDAELRSFNAGLSSIWNMPLSQRQSLIKSWEKKVDKEALAQKMMSLYVESQHHEQEIKRIRNERDGRIMAAHNIVAMTTTACAARWEVLRALDLQIVICEEAAEIMEAHTLCSLLPSVEHAVFIGDPQQLRPEANEQMLSLGSSVGRQYRLDESLLERLMMPQDVSAHSIPASHLSIQRRMHPQIADITRLTYPYLKDHESTHARSPVHGLAQRMFWWDHRSPELEADDLKSHANLHEVEMVASLVEYLLCRGAYEQAEIAVLTPYAGQLLRLYKRLEATCDIWLSDKDREAMLEEELLALGEEGRTTKDKVVMSNMLRIATVDNFQGQEAKVIILSTVRSGGKAGFLKILNRINVACSRARNVLYSPNCRHLVEVSQLDTINLCGVYEVDINGTILAINSDIRLPYLHEPKCICGAQLEGTRRYRIHSKLVRFNRTLDLLLAKMGRKLANFGSAIETLEKELDETFDVFVEAIRPNPLAAKANATLLLRRSRDILDLQTQITDFRKGVVDLVRRDLARLNAAFPNVVPSYNLMFHLHFDILGYRAVSVRLADVLKLGSQLLNPQDPSFSVQRQGLKMIQFVHRESIACIEFCKDTLTDPLLMTNPSVEAEIRLQQLQFLLFARSTRVRLVHLGSPVEDTAPAMDVDAIKDSLDAATKLVRSSLRTCAPFGQTARDFANIFASADEVPSSSPIPAIKNAHVRETEKLWGQHRLGHLRTCAKNHVYSSKTFSDACPECGKGAQISSNEVFRKSSKHLFEIQFLEAMHAKSASARHVEPPKAEGAARDRSENDGPVLREEAEEALGQPTRELTQEERFLRAMRNGLPKIQGGRTGV